MPETPRSPQTTAPKEPSTEKLSPEDVCHLVVSALEDMKGQNILSLDIGEVTDIADYMVIASGTSNRHVKALVDSVIERSKAVGHRPANVEGKDTQEWVLLDLGDVIVHVMQQKTRDFYDLESLWAEFSSVESSV